MEKYGRCGKKFGMIFTSKKKAEESRKKWNKDAKEGDINLRHRVFKCGRSKYVMVTETKKL